jgi:hypothetical protein
VTLQRLAEWLISARPSQRSVRSAGYIAANNRGGEAVRALRLVEAAGVEPNRTLVFSVTY